MNNRTFWAETQRGNIYEVVEINTIPMGVCYRHTSIEGFNQIFKTIYTTYPLRIKMTQNENDNRHTIININICRKLWMEEDER